MALSRELLKRLNSEDDPLPKRLKLAETAFSAVDLPLIQKEDILLDWLCKICVTNQHAWKTLNNCLRSTHVDIKINIKQHLVDKLTSTLNDLTEETYEEVLECCTLILVNNSMRQYFIKKPEDLGLLVKTLLNTMLKYSGYYNETQKKDKELLESCKLSSTENCTIISIIESIMQIYRQSVTTKEELRTIFTRDILYPMCNLIDHRHTDSTNKLDIVAYKCIQYLLLGKRNTQNDQTTENSCIMFPDLFYVLSENVEKLSLQSNLATYLFILRAIVGTYKSDATLLDILFRNLIDASGRYKWEILNVSLQLLNDVSLNFENAIENVTLSEYFQKLISNILTNDNVTCIQYSILVKLSYINPLLIEKNIPNILNKIFMEEQSANYTNLLIAILYASTKLRREQKLISQLLISVKQHVAVKKKHKTSTSTFFPQEFKMKLVKSISNISSSQTFASLKTIMYHLNTDCVELLQDNTSCKNVLILKVAVELLVTLFEGMQIFEYTRVSSTHEKFVNILDELGNTLSLLINKALCLSHNKHVTIILLTAVQSLSEMQNMLKYYVPKVAGVKTLPFPIQDDSWQQLIQRISNFGEDNCKNVMNKLILHRIKLNLSDEPVKLHSLIGGLEYSWSTILKHDPNILSLLRDKEISKVAYLLLTDMASSEKNFHEWLNILDKECIQENKYFLMYLLSHILIQIGQCFSSGCTKSITEHINAKLLMEDKHNENEKLSKVLQVIKEQISQQQWMPMTNTSSKIEFYLEMLLHIPIIYFNPNTRTLIFLVVYSINKECETNEKILALCNSIFSDLLEKIGIDIFQHIEPAVLVNQLPQNKAFSKAYEFSLRNVTTYSTLKNLIKSSAQCKEAMCTVLERMEIVKSKLNPEQKIIFKKAERKLVKTILNILPEEINDAFDVRCLTAVLKVKISTKKISDTLKELTKSTLQNIFTAKENLSDSINGELLQTGVQLATIVLRHRKEFEIQGATVVNLWFVVLEHPCENLRKSLLASTQVKEFCEFVKLLYDETIKSLSQGNEAAWTNLLIVWSDIIKTDMHAKRSKVRLDAINNLFETAQSLHIPDRCWSDLVRLSHDIISTKHLLIPNDTFDLIITISLKSLEKVKMSCENVLTLCGALIKVRTNLITDSLPALLLLYRRVVNVIVHASKNISNKFEEHRFRCFAFDIEKFTGLLIKLKKDMMRLSPYLIADLLQLILESTIPFYIKVALQNSLCHLISICDQHGIALLSRTLPISLQEVFKVQLNTFNKFHKYSGKI